MSEVKEDTAKILVVEDSPTQASVISSIVASMGYEPAVYHRLDKSVGEILEIEKPVLVLLDLRLLDDKGVPVGDGFQICKEIKRVNKSLPVFILSSEPQEEAADWARMQGADAFLQKPFSPDDLKLLIANFEVSKK